MADIACSNCSALNRPQAKFCTVCGLPISSSQVRRLPNQGVVAATQLMSTNPSIAAELTGVDGTVYTLQSLTIIGRDPNVCQLALPDEKLSRSHAQIEEQAGEWILTDLNSTNGTYLNGKKLATAAKLKSGDEIRMGMAVYRFRRTGESDLQPMIHNANMSLGQIRSNDIVAPSIAWRVWKKPPVAEGFVRQISDRYMMKKDDLAKRGCIAALLAYFISPALAFLPFIQGSEIPARDLRIEDQLTGTMIDIKIIGEVMGNINLGDPLAVWTKNLNGLLLMESAYNYATNTNISIKK